MESFKEILSPDFLLRNSVYTSVLVGFACPLVGVFLVLRRLVFMGVALPQISSTGVAVALSLPVWLGLTVNSAEEHAHTLAFIGSTVFTLVAILILALLERRGRGSAEGRLGTAYVVATALSILLLSKKSRRRSRLVGFVERRNHHHLQLRPRLNRDFARVCAGRAGTVQ